MIEIGNVKVHFVSDGIYWTEAGGLFGLVPRALWEKIIAADALNRVPMALRCLLIEANGKRIVVDTGYGDKLTDKQRGFLSLQGERRLLASLTRVGVRAEDVDIVLCTHMHGDHISGNTRWNEAGEAVPVFPNAEYWVQRWELADARYPDERTRGTYLPDNFEPLLKTGQLKVIDGDTDITPEVYTSITPGHTRAHQSVFIESNGQAALYLADAAQWAFTLERLGWVPAYDVEPLVSIQTKKRLARWALRHHALLIFNHDPRIAAARLQEAEEGRYVVIPEITDPLPEYVAPPKP